MTLITSTRTGEDQVGFMETRSKAGLREVQLSDTFAIEVDMSRIACHAENCPPFPL